MIKKTSTDNTNKEQSNLPGKKVYGDPVYGPEEDIYGNAKKADIDPETEEPLVSSFEEEEGWNEKGEDDDIMGDDLDVPGSELDDAEEKIGEEDEENNYYSVGGDNHEDLEESNPDQA